MKIKKFLSAILCICILISFAGCGNNQKPSYDYSDADYNKREVSDFYSETNADWFVENSLYDSEISISVSDYVSADAYYKFIELLKRENAADLPEGDSIKKLSYYYNRLRCSQDYKDAKICILTQLEQILNWTSVDDFQTYITLYDFWTMNSFMKVTYYKTSSGQVVPYFQPDTIGNIDGILDEDIYKVYKQAFTNILIAMGYEQDYATIIVNNGLKVDKSLRENRNQAASSYAEYSYFYLASKEYNLKYVDILKENGYIFDEHASRNSIAFSAPVGYIKWLEENITDENIDAIKCYFALKYIEYTIEINSNSANYEYRKIWSDLGGATETNMLSFPDRAARALYYENLDSYIPAFYNAYAKEWVLDDIAAFETEIKEAYIEMINDYKWLNYIDKKKLKKKFVSLSIDTDSAAVANESYNFSETGRAVDSFFSYKESNIHFIQEQAKKGIVWGDTYNYFQANAYYSALDNTIYILGGYITNPLYTEESPYEVKLAIMGSMMAHEMGHSIDPVNILYDYIDNYNEGIAKRSDEYYSFCDELCDYYSSFTTANGNEINGSSFKNEIVADYLAMEVMLRVLEKHENVDYELFFDTYAGYNAEILRKEYEDIMLKYFEHPTYRERVNCTLAHFDKFYETFNVSTDSPYFLSKDERISLY